MEVSVKYIDPSYMVRATMAGATDAILCSQLAQNAVHGAMVGPHSQPMPARHYACERGKRDARRWVLVSLHSVGVRRCCGVLQSFAFVWASLQVHAS